MKTKTYTRNDIIDKISYKLNMNYEESKIIIVSLIDNLIKGASGQAVQCMNLMSNFPDASMKIDNIENGKYIFNIQDSVKKFNYQIEFTLN